MDLPLKRKRKQLIKIENDNSEEDSVVEVSSDNEEDYVPSPERKKVKREPVKKEPKPKVFYYLIR